MMIEINYTGKGRGLSVRLKQDGINGHGIGRLINRADMAPILDVF